jgi:hypothetical protein
MHDVACAREEPENARHATSASETETAEEQASGSGGAGQQSGKAAVARAVANHGVPRQRRSQRVKFAGAALKRLARRQRVSGALPQFYATKPPKGHELPPRRKRQALQRVNVSNQR